MIAPKPIDEMKSSKTEVKNQLHNAHSDQRKYEEMDITEDLHEYKESLVEINNSPPSLG